MKYLIQMSSPAGAWDALSPEEQQRIVGEHESFGKDLESSGKYVTSFRLRPPQEARCVRRDVAGALSESDGAFAETAEEIGGLYVIEADSMEEALAWARRSRFMVGTNEVRPVWED